jgi:enoyl-[acyl-carrier protein] reductase I
VSDWLGLAGRTVLVAGVSSRRSLGFAVGQRLAEVGAAVHWTVHTEARRAELAGKLAPGTVHVCDVARDQDIADLAASLSASGTRLDGLVHSIAFARYRAEAGAPRPFHRTSRADFLEAVDVSCFSLVALVHALEGVFRSGGAIVATSISTTRMAAEGYGFMAPAKAALDSTVAFLAKSLAREPGVRVNAVCAGPLKTPSSAGIPGYLESYLFAEACTLRKRGLATQEVADAILYLLSPRSAGVNGQGLVVDAGMGLNYFDADVVRRATRPDPPAGPAAERGA